MTWEQLLKSLRQGDGKIATNKDGLPTIATNAPIYELMQIMVAMTEGYNRNVNRIDMMRKIVKANRKKEVN